MTDETTDAAVPPLRRRSARSQSPAAADVAPDLAPTPGVAVPVDLTPAPAASAIVNAPVEPAPAEPATPAIPAPATAPATAATAVTTTGLSVPAADATTTTTDADIAASTTADPVVAWAPPKPRRPLALAAWALAVAIVALMLSFIVGWGFPIGIIAIITAVTALRRRGQSRGVAGWALALAILSVIYSALWIAWAFSEGPLF